MSNCKLTDTQLIVLSGAAQREDRCLVAPQKLKGGAAQKFAAKLLAIGLVKEIKAKPKMPAWRRDEEAEQSYSLKLTAAGMKAIAVGDGGKGTEAHERPSATIDDAADATEKSGTTSPSSMSAPRASTKLAQVIGLLRRDRGATLAELVAATGWLPHTTRAALTGLRKRGYAVTLDRSNKEPGYCIREGRGVADKNEGLASNKCARQANEPLATELPTTPEARSKTAVRLTSRERAARPPKRKAA